MFLFLAFVCIAVFGCSVQGQTPCSHYQVIYSWTFSLPIAWDRKNLPNNYRLSSERVPIAIRPLGDKLIINIPRWSNLRHPINIGWLPRVSDTCTKEIQDSATVEPFPNWEMQEIGNCRAFQFVQGFEIEPDTSIMWMPDSGLKGVNCPAKITLLDGKTKQIIHQYSFPKNVATPSFNFLNDIALDVADPKNKFAYLSDSKRGRIVVFSLKLNTSWTVEHHTMKANFRAINFDFLAPSGTQRRIITDNHVNGIALSPAKTGSKTLYYRPLVSYDLFAVDTRFLRNESMSSSLRESNFIKVSKTRQTWQGDGMIVDENGFLYTAEVTKNTIMKWDLENRVPQVYYQNNRTLIWGDSFAIDEDGFMWVTTRGWPIDSHNRILRFRIGAKSYLSKN